MASPDLSSNKYQAQHLYSKPNEYGTVSPQRYSYSWSGADAKARVYYSQRPDLIRSLESVHTISVSVHEAKSQARSLGHRGIRGLARGVRTIAGSLILTVVNDHPLRALMEMYNDMIAQDLNATNTIFGWSVDRDDVGVGSYKDLFNFQNRMCSLLPPFNLLIEFVSEAAPVTIDATSTDGSAFNIGSKIGAVTSGGKSTKSQETVQTLFPGAGLLLQDIEILDESFVVSVNDMVTEITCSYIARDYKPISADTFSSGGTGAITNSEIAAREAELFFKCHPDHVSKTEQVIPESDLGRLLPGSPQYEKLERTFSVTPTEVK